MALPVHTIVLALMLAVWGCRIVILTPLELTGAQVPACTTALNHVSVLRLPMVLPIRVVEVTLMSVAPVKLALVARCHLVTLPTLPERLRLLVGAVPEQMFWSAEAVPPTGVVTVTVAEPFMVAVQLLLLVATTVYVPAVDILPKLMAVPSPGTDPPTLLLPFLSWYITPLIELAKPTATLVPGHTSPPPVTVRPLGRALTETVVEAVFEQEPLLTVRVTEYEPVVLELQVTGLPVVLVKLPPGETAQLKLGGIFVTLAVLGVMATLWLESVMLTPAQTVLLERLMLAVGLLLTEMLVLVLAVQVPLLTVRLTV
jgi:hypothetical protein